MIVRIISLVATLAAFVLTLLLLLSGRTPSYLPSLHILELNTTRLVPADTIDDVLSDTGISAIDELADRFSETASDVINTAAEELGLHDYYTAHVLTYCWRQEGESLSGCDGQHVPFDFDPIPVLEEDLIPGVGLEDIGFPVEDVRTGIEVLKVVYRVMGIFILVSCIVAGVCVLLGIWGLFSGRLTAVVLGILMGSSALLLIIAAIMATVIAIKVRDILNRELEDVGISAEESRNFLGVLWGGVAAALLAFVGWSVGCCVGGRSRRHGKERVEYGDESLVDGQRRRRRWRF
jgi:hypothetical protein